MAKSYKDKIDKEINLMNVPTVTTWPQIRRDSFLVIRLAKSTKGGLLAGLPDRTKI